jgi:hypothetical protein
MNLHVEDWCHPGDKCPPLPGCNRLVSKPTRQATEVKLLSSLSFRKWQPILRLPEQRVRNILTSKQVVETYNLSEIICVPGVKKQIKYSAQYKVCGKIYDLLLQPVSSTAANILFDCVPTSYIMLLI